MERCSNCAKYPFCGRIVAPTGKCNDWIEREEQ